MVNLLRRVSLILETRINIMDVPTDINRIENQKAVTIYPNPVSDVLNIEGADDGEKIRIYNAFGVKLIETLSRTIDTTSLSTGIYFGIFRKCRSFL